MSSLWGQKVFLHGMPDLAEKAAMLADPFLPVVAVIRVYPVV